MLEYFQYYPEIDLFASRLNTQLLRLQKISADKATGLLVVPNWPAQIYFPFSMDMLISEPFIIPSSINQLKLPSNMIETHPL